MISPLIPGGSASMILDHRALARRLHGPRSVASRRNGERESTARVAASGAPLQRSPVDPMTTRPQSKAIAGDRWKVAHALRATQDLHRRRRIDAVAQGGGGDVGLTTGKDLRYSAVERTSTTRMGRPLRTSWRRSTLHVVSRATSAPAAKAAAKARALLTEGRGRSRPRPKERRR